MSILKKEFFERSTLKITKELLGKFLVVQHPTLDKKAYMITDVEAYDGPYDKASHAHNGKTIRNAPMFGEAGVWYVYFVYGMHNMLNIVTGPKDYPAAVLIRGCVLVNPKHEIRNLKQIQKFKYLNFKNLDIFSNFDIQISNLKLGGPAKLTKFLKIDRKFNGKKAVPKNNLWIEDLGVKIKKSQIKTSPRIGVNYAGEWKDKHFRFYL